MLTPKSTRVFPPRRHVSWPSFRQSRIVINCAFPPSSLLSRSRLSACPGGLHTMSAATSSLQGRTAAQIGSCTRRRGSIVTCVAAPEKGTSGSAMRAEDFVRPHLLKLKAYTPIEPFEILAQRLGREAKDIVKLDANENPYGPPPEVLAALGSMSWPNIYPDPESRRLREGLAQWHGVPAEHLLVSCWGGMCCVPPAGCAAGSGHEGGLHAASQDILACACMLALPVDKQQAARAWTVVSLADAEPSTVPLLDPECRPRLARLPAPTRPPASAAAAVPAVQVGCGADELIDLLMRCVLDEGDLIVDCPPTFTM